MTVRALALAFLLAWAPLVASAFAGHASQEQEDEREQATIERAPLPRAAYERPTGRPSAGSLWNGGPIWIDWFSDTRARAIGDLVTIQIVENVRASQQADTESERDSDISGGIDQLFGLQNFLPDDLELSQLLGAASSSSFAGGGANTRANTLNATITATVVDALPNGNLVVEATRAVRVNEEEESLTLRGMVRRFDIGPLNVVPSTAVADVEILYGGKGVIAKNLKPSLLFRIFGFIF